VSTKESAIRTADSAGAAVAFRWNRPDCSTAMKAATPPNAITIMAMTEMGWKKYRMDRR
jgi:hypothetical protein